MAKIKIRQGETYYKDGQEVVVLNMGEIVLGKNKYDGVVYRFKDKDGRAIIQEKSVFLKSVIPTELNLEDRVVATCMGKILATYKIEQSAPRLSTGISQNGNRMNFFTKIEPNGFVKPSTEVNYLTRQTEYIFVSPQLEKKLAIRKEINYCLSKIGNIKSKLSSDNIDYQNTDIDEMIDIEKNIQDLDNQISNKIKFLENE